MTIFSLSPSMFLLFFIIQICLFISVDSLREFRSWSTRHGCSMAKDANYPFAYAKYAGQTMEYKGRVNSNQQDFRHSCEVRGGSSKCNICEVFWDTGGYGT